MGMFNTRKPRKFRSVHIYTDESREKLEKLVRDVKREQGMLEEENKPYDPAKFKGKFGHYTPRVQRHKESSFRMGWPVVIVLLLALMLVWRFLLSGTTY